MNNNITMKVTMATITLVLSIRIVIVAMVTLIGILCLTGVVYQDCDCYHGSFDWYSMFARCLNESYHGNNHNPHNKFQ
jgi:hypothetical protein